MSSLFTKKLDKINQKNVDDQKAHFRSVRAQLEEKATQLVNDLNNLAG